MVWYFHLFKNFPQFVVIHTVKGISIVNEAEIDVFLECPCFLCDPTEAGNLISGSSTVSISGLYIWKNLVHILLKSSLRDFKFYLASLWNEHNCTVVWTFFGIDFVWDWNENWPFPVLWPLWSFPNLLTYWVQHFHSIIFRIWNSSTGIPSPPLALLIVMLPEIHLTSYSRMPGFRWVITPSWLSESLRPFLYSSPLDSCHLFIIISSPVRSLTFQSSFGPILAGNFPLISPVFLKRSLVFIILLFSSISLHCSFKKAFFCLLAIL